MNLFQFLLGICLIIGLVSVLRSRRGGPGVASGAIGLQPHESAEAERLRAEVRELKERIQVLERITVDKESSLARQIEELRDRP